MVRNVMIAVGVALLASIGIATAQQQKSGPLVEVFKTPTCGCCSKWVEHLRTSGFNVRTNDMNDVGEIKRTRGVPDHLQSCHTAVVEGYVIEGHVPAADVHRLLKEKPAVAGIAVGGMPIGSPGMEFPGSKGDSYDVVAFDKAGTTRVFAKH